MVKLVEGVDWFGNWSYRVFRHHDLKPFDTFGSRIKLTWAQIADVEQSYTEALDGYVLGGVHSSHTRT